MTDQDASFVFCSMCGVRLKSGNRFCPKCGSQLIQANHLDQFDSPRRKRSHAGKYIVLLLLFAGVGAVIEYRYGGALFVTKVTGPSNIKFGTDYKEDYGNISIVGERNSFKLSDKFAFIAVLRGPVRAGHVDLLLTGVSTSSGGEVVIKKERIEIADPRFNVIYFKAPSIWMRFPELFMSE